ncbi:MAG: bifunctional DNA-formamidopyrimidine glycosylase/DNA-(apurinic or apyrimidinic site) lyase [bacterium]|nr:bifunctional DNA-formamidopyrimidine glycosylase/DNA-(apurinic or apyrimidinic site) lyase [bacterium]
MPELPEVQTVVNDLNKRVAGRKITGVWFDWPKMLKDPLDQQRNKIAHKHVEVFQKVIKGKKILEVKRRAKNILMYLSGNLVLLTHLKMTGHYLVGKWKIERAKTRGVRPRAIPISPPEMVNDPYNRYIHIIFYLDNGQQLALSDLRKFAKAVLGTKEQIENLPELLKLGPEANDPKLTLEKFKTLILKERRKIKQVLMDPEVIAGIGNIYSDEILWQSRIHPFKPANKLKDEEIKIMYLAMKIILAKALKLRGTSSSDYRDTAGKKGGYDKVLLAYDREGEPCKRCGAKIVRKKIGGRSAHFCPRCQVLI